MENRVNVSNKQCYDHLDQDPKYENLRVQWEADNGNAPILTNEEKLYPEVNKQFTMLIYFKVCGNSCRKIFLAIFYLQGKKHGVVIGGTAAQCWFDGETSTIKSLADLNSGLSGFSFTDGPKKSNTEPFPEKLVPDPGCKAKLIKIEVMYDESNDMHKKGFKADTEDSGDPENSEITSEDSGDEEIETSVDERGAEHIQTERQQQMLHL